MKEVIGFGIFMLVMALVFSKPEQVGGYFGKVVHSFEQAKQ
ncbi:hypothetical protein [Xylophilus sp.]|nr:hypothetical protein [Xylophilus sp.]KAF1041653.1 MAG: hypothetical protein GAK38_04529 [Xylophilus sp.]